MFFKLFVSELLLDGNEHFMKCLFFSIFPVGKADSCWPGLVAFMTKNRFITFCVPHTNIHNGIDMKY
jgi:hypothetical protein